MKYFYENFLLLSLQFDITCGVYNSITKRIHSTNNIHGQTNFCQLLKLI